MKKMLITLLLFVPIGVQAQTVVMAEGNSFFGSTVNKYGWIQTTTLLDNTGLLGFGFVGCIPGSDWWCEFLVGVSQSMERNGVYTEFGVSAGIEQPTFSWREAAYWYRLGRVTEGLVFVEMGTDFWFLSTFQYKFETGYGFGLRCEQYKGCGPLTSLALGPVSVWATYLIPFWRAEEEVQAGSGPQIGLFITKTFRGK